MTDSNVIREKWQTRIRECATVIREKWHRQAGSSFEANTAVFVCDFAIA
jgi:hypothetical protein